MSVLWILPYSFVQVVCHAHAFPKAAIPQLDFKWKGKKYKKTIIFYTGLETTNIFRNVSETEFSQWTEIPTNLNPNYWLGLEPHSTWASEAQSHNRFNQIALKEGHELYQTGLRSKSVPLWSLEFATESSHYRYLPGLWDFWPKSQWSGSRWLLHFWRLSRRQQILLAWSSSSQEKSEPKGDPGVSESEAGMTQSRDC